MSDTKPPFGPAAPDTADPDPATEGDGTPVENPSG